MQALAGKQAAEDRQRCLERLRSSIIMGDGVMASVDWTMTRTTIELHEVMSDAELSRVVDVKLMTCLKSSNIINWCRTVRPIYPLRSHTSGTEWNGSRDSLLVAMTTAMWGSGDAQLVELVRRLVYVALTRSESAARLTERSVADFIDESDAAVAHRRMTDRPSDVTRDTGSAQWRRVINVFSEHADQSAAVIKPIHIFVLSSVIRRPVIVVGQTDCTGVYLPVVHAPTHCCRSPLVVLHVADQFVPLVPRAGHSPMEPAVPLWRADTDEPLAVRCLLDSESPQLALTSYLDVVERTHTSATSVGLFPVAKYDVIAPDINIVDQCLAPDATQPYTLPVRSPTRLS